MTLKDPDAFEAAAAELGVRLRDRAADLSVATSFLQDLDTFLGSMTISRRDAMNPHLLQSLENGARKAALALAIEDRSSLRMGLEAVRVAFRDFHAESASASTTDPADAVALINTVLAEINAQDVADLLGVSARSWTRWLKGADVGAEHIDRVRAIAAALIHLRWSFYPSGIMSWFTRPHAQLDEHTPMAALDDPTKLSAVVSAAAGSRVAIAS
jgi:transcriptional regulator with XRE-family HTH domain